jgi:ATP-dependent DNA ligase
VEQARGGLHGSVSRRYAEAVRSLNVDKALIDGEAVVLRKDGRSDFLALLTKRGGAQATLVASVAAECGLGRERSRRAVS